MVPRGRCRGERLGATGCRPHAGSAEGDKGDTDVRHHRRVLGGLRALRVHARRADARCSPGVGERRRAGRPRPHRSRAPTSCAAAGSPSRGARCGRRSARSPSAGGPRRSWTGWPDSSAPPPGSATCPGCSARHAAPSDALTDLRTAYARIYSAVAEVTGARVIVDASKGPALGQALAGAPGIDLRMLNVVRDPRAVAWSWKRHASAPTPRPAPKRCGGSRRTGQRRSGAPSSSRCRPSCGSEASGRTAAVRGLRRRPRRDGGGSDHHARCPARRRRSPARRATGRVVLGPSHGLSGNPARFRSGAVELRRDDAWTTEMPARDRAVVTALTLPLLMAYGYTGDRRTRRRAPPTRPDTKRGTSRDRTWT